MGSSAISLPITDTSCQVKKVPDHFKLVDNLQAALSQLGDGFYAWRQKVDIGGGVLKTVKELNGEVLPKTGKTIKMRDFDALIDGVRIGDKNKSQYDPNNFTDYTVQGSGTIYLVLKPVKIKGDDGYDRPDYARGVIDEMTTAPELNSGVILAAKLTNVPVSGTITSDIDNSVKDYLIDMDELNKDLRLLIDEVTQYSYEYLYNLIITSVDTLRTEIAAGDQALATEIHNRCTALETIVNQHTLDIDDLRTQLSLFKDWVTYYINKLTTKTEELQQADADLLSAIEENANFINQVNERVNALTGDLQTLLARVDSLESRMTSAENDILIIKTQDIVNLYTYITEQINLTKIEIAQGDQSVLDELNTKISTLRSDLTEALNALRTEIEENINIAIAQLRIDMEAMQTLILTEIQPIINQLSVDLQNAVYNLTTLINGNTAQIEELIRRLNLDESYITTLQQQVQNPVTGLKDRMNAAENQVNLIPGISSKLDNIGNLVDVLNGYLKGLVDDVKYDQVTESDFDIGSTYGISPEGYFILPIDTQAGLLFSDNFNLPNGPVDPSKWTIISGAWQIQNNMLYGPNGGIKTITTFADGEITFKVKTLSPAQSGSQWVSNVRIGLRSDNTYWQTGLTTINTIFRFISNTIDGNITDAYLYLWNAYTNGVDQGIYYCYNLHSNAFASKTHADLKEIKIVLNGNIFTVYFEGQYYGQFGPIPSGNLGARPLAFGEQDSPLYFDDVTVRSLIPGYALSGIITTKKLTSVDPVIKGLIEVVDEKPTNTTVTYDITFNGGTNWVTGITNRQLIDALSLPFNGTGNDLRIRINMATTNMNASPKVKSLYGVTSASISGTRYVQFKDKINEVITAINTNTTPLVTPINPLS